MSKHGKRSVSENVRVTVSKHGPIFKVEIEQNNIDAAKTTFLIADEMFYQLLNAMNIQIVVPKHNEDHNAMVTSIGTIEMHINDLLRFGMNLSNNNTNPEKMSIISTGDTFNQSVTKHNYPIPMILSNDEIGTNSDFVVPSQIEALPDIITFCLERDDIVEIEVPHNGEIKTMVFHNEMWWNLSKIMMTKIGRLLKTAGDRIDEIDSIASLFSDRWFRGSVPISKYSLIWDFRKETNEKSAINNGDTDTSISSGSSSLSDSSDSIILSDIEISSDDYDTCDASISSIDSIDDDDSFQRRLYSLYHPGK